MSPDRVKSIPIKLLTAGYLLATTACASQEPTVSAGLLATKILPSGARLVAIDVQAEARFFRVLLSNNPNERGRVIATLFGKGRHFDIPDDLRADATLMTTAADGMVYVTLLERAEKGRMNFITVEACEMMGVCNKSEPVIVP